MELSNILSMVKETKVLITGRGCIAECTDIINKHWKNHTAIIIADTNTWNAAGKKVRNLLQSAGIKASKPVIFEVPPLLHADYENTDRILQAISKHDECVPVAVGSGTINDLVKRASFEAGLSYFCIGTAASMDGYCSSGAALSKNGRKQTMECPAPKAVLADTDILKTAPKEASAAGYGDLASKLTAGADWILADFTGDDPIDPQTWQIVQPNLQRWLSSPNDLSAIFEGLNYSGLAMQALGRSRAASGAEHLLSHIWEMSGHCYSSGQPVSHGFQVSVGIMLTAALYEQVFSFEADDISIEEALSAYPDWHDRKIEIENLMGGLPSWQDYIDIVKQKHLSKDELRIKLKKILTGWNELRTKIREKLPAYESLKKMLSSAGCPVTPAEIDLNMEDAVSALHKAQCMRNRYTILDLAYELGVFYKCTEKIKKEQF